MIPFNRIGYFLVIMVTHTAVHAAGTVSSAQSTIDFPHDQAYINTGQPTIIGTLRDNNGNPVMNETVQLLINGVVVGSTLSDSNGIYRFLVLNNLADGQYELSIFCAESQAAVESNIFNVDTTFPSVFITYPQENTVITSEQFTVSGTAEALAMVMIYLDANPFGDIGYADEYGNWFIEYDATNGNHSIAAQATNIAGNQGSMSEVINFSVTV